MYEKRKLEPSFCGYYYEFCSPRDYNQEYALLLDNIKIRHLDDAMFGYMFVNEVFLKGI